MRVEIGTSDFDTAAGYEPGLYVEPVPEYFNRLSISNGGIKERVIVSNYEGESDIYYVPSSTIKELNLPDYFRGCNSFDKPHPTVTRILNNLGLSTELIAREKTPVIRIKTLLDKYSIKHIDYLKIDTEGHDFVIINDFFDTVNFRPFVIQCEANQLTSEENVTQIKNRLIALNYRIVKSQNDIVAVCN